MNKIVIILLAISVIANFYLFSISDSEVADESDATTFILSEGKRVYLTVHDQKVDEDHKMSIQAQPGEVIEVHVRPALENELEYTMTLNEMLNAVIGSKNSSANKGLRITPVNELKNSWLNFQWQDPLHPELVKLRKNEKLDLVIQNAKSELEKFISLQNWVRKQWKLSSPNPYPDWNANIILKMIRSGQTGGFCGQYSHVLTQCLQSFGYTARYLSLKNHFSMEVYWNEKAKWISLDPLYNCIFKEGENILSSYEVYTMLSNGKEAQIELLNTETNKAITGKERNTILDHYTEVTYVLKADHLNDRKSGLYFVENSWKHSAALIDKNLPKRNFLGKTPILTDHLNEIYFPTNNVSMKVLTVDNSSISLELNSKYNIVEYQVSINNTAFKKCDSTFKVENNSSLKNLKFRGKTNMGIIGPSTSYDLKR